jgi:hypothetical protein
MVFLLAVLFVPAALAAYLLKDSKWPIIIPFAIAALMFVIAALPIKRKVTPQQWASELEPHLLGTDGMWGWDDAIGARLAHPGLEALRAKMSKFDLLPTEERRREFASLIAALKRGEIPEINE